MRLWTISATMMIGWGKTEPEGSPKVDLLLPVLVRSMLYLFAL